MMKYREIEASDVGRGFIKAFGKTWLVLGFMGRIFPGDVGKRIYRAGDILQVENDEQFKKRIKGGLPK